MPAVKGSKRDPIDEAAEGLALMAYGVAPFLGISASDLLKLAAEKAPAVVAAKEAELEAKDAEL